MRDKRPGGTADSDGDARRDGASQIGKRTLVEQIDHAAGSPVQRKATSAESGAPDQRVQAAAAHGTSGSITSLPYSQQIQHLFGRHDVSSVKAHVGGAAAEGAAAMGAKAFATGDHVAFASAPDLHIAAHEAAHVVQQRAGVQLAGGIGGVADRYEQHADAVADLVVQGKSAESVLDEHAGGASRAGGTAIQKMTSDHEASTAASDSGHAQPPPDQAPPSATKEAISFGLIYGSHDRIDNLIDLHVKAKGGPRRRAETRRHARRPQPLLRPHEGVRGRHWKAR
jgi:hypothetical protein